MFEREERLRTILILALMMTGACTEPFYPPDAANTGGQLVIDGFINGTEKTAVLKLSRALALADASQSPPESNATVTITSSSGSEFTLVEDNESPGNYMQSNLSLDPGATYKLNITTTSGRSYHSDDVKILPSPTLDSVVWRPSETGIRFYVNGHDDSNNTRYYRWTFNETWEYNTVIFSWFKKVNKLPVYRDFPTEQVYSCWQTAASSNIMVESTKRLANDVVSMFPLYFIKKGSRKLGHIYKFELTQHAISQDEYEFWQLMRKTTETVGGLFDPMPSQVLGNVHSSEDPDESVLGFFSAGFVEQKFIYVGFLELPGYLREIDTYTFDCSGGRLLYLSELQTIKDDEEYVNQVGTPIYGYTVAKENCANCRKLGGDNVRPPDWPVIWPVE